MASEHETYVSKRRFDFLAARLAEGERLVPQLVAMIERMHESEEPWPEPSLLRDARIWAGAGKAEGRAEPDDLLMTAWAVIANAGGGDWTRETKAWQEAAHRWGVRAGFRQAEPTPEEPKRGTWVCSNCGTTEYREREVLCWKCGGKGEMRYVQEGFFARGKDGQYHPDPAQPSAEVEAEAREIAAEVLKHYHCAKEGARGDNPRVICDCLLEERRAALAAELLDWHRRHGGK